MNRNSASNPSEGLGYKLACLLNTLEQMDSCVVAFSGGVDSTVLLAAAVRALGRRAQAATVCTPYVPAWELDDARELAHTIGARHQVLEMEMPEELRDNPERRCYLCKRRILSRLKAHARDESLAVVIDGSNADDGTAYRPGMQALKEMEVRSPLAECGLSKSDVRQLARSWNLTVWNKPAYSCLLTRLPHDTEVDLDSLRRVEEAERFLMREGFAAVRVRTHGKIARIEVPPEDRERLCSFELMDRIDGTLRGLGYRHVTLDLAGYRSGSMDPQHRSA